LKRDFYAEMCRVENWSVRALTKKINTMLYERTALSKKPKKLIAQEIQLPTDPLNGRITFEEKKCIACHAVGDTEGQRVLI